MNQDNQIYATRNLGRQWIRIDFGLPLDAQIDFLSMVKRFYLYVGGWRLGVRKSIEPFPTLMQLQESNR